MRNRILLCLLPFVLLAEACQAGSVQPAPSIDVQYTPLTAGAAQAQIDQEVVERLQEEHYSPLALDDSFSQQLLDAYLDDLDATHSVLLESDVAYLKSRYGNVLDEQLQQGDLTAAFDIYNTYQQRRIQIDQWVLDKLAAGVDALDLSDKESVQLDRENAPWPADLAARHELWRKQLENQSINLRLSEDIAAEDIQERLTKRYQNELEQLRQTEPMDVVSAYMGAFTASYDPHTDYFTPRRSEDFEIGMSLSLQGIGAQLRSRQGYPELVRLIPGGPAAKSGKLKPTDRITAVAQGKEGEFVDVVGMRLDEAVQLIRGKKGSTVRLQLLTDDAGGSKTVALVRDTIELKDRAASKRLLEIERDGGTQKVALIRLPSFYKGTAADVRKLLEEAIEEDVAGVIMDLRNNGGGALTEVTKLVGLFMPSAPSVQIRDAGGNTQVLGDTNDGPVYDGALAVMVNRLSASASEIFAGAIQDYGRGLIVGNQTFGKGTVQALMPLSRGRIKLTQAKFYRVTGASTQDRGVRPDITFPAVVNPDEIGENALPNALPWDQIEPTRFPRIGALTPLVPGLRDRHAARIGNDPEFRYRVARIELARRYGAREHLSLNLAERRAQRAEREQQQLALANEHQLAIGEEPFADYAAFEASEEAESPQAEIANQLPDSEESDAYQSETASILLDMLQLLRESQEQAV